MSHTPRFLQRVHPVIGVGSLAINSWVGPGATWALDAYDDYYVADQWWEGIAVARAYRKTGAYFFGNGAFSLAHSYFGNAGYNFAGGSIGTTYTASNGEDVHTPSGPNTTGTMSSTFNGGYAIPSNDGNQAGFKITVPAISTSPRTVYVMGKAFAAWYLHASFSDGSAADADQALTHAGSDFFYQINFQAGSSCTLTLTIQKQNAAADPGAPRTFAIGPWALTI